MALKWLYPKNDMVIVLIDIYKMADLEPLYNKNWNLRKPTLKFFPTLDPVYRNFIICSYGFQMILSKKWIVW